MQEITFSMGGVSMELLDLDSDKFVHLSGEDVVSQLRSALDEVLQLNDTELQSNTEKNRAWEHDKTRLNVPPSTSVKCLCKSATFPVMDSKDKAHAPESDENAAYLHSMSLPVQRKLIPAIKGSREKEGLSLRKLSVSWAPDVYDPIPSAVSHLPKKTTSQQYRNNNKKHGKGKNNKAKNSRGSSKKDKKHHREEPSLGRCKITMEPIAVADTEKKFAMDDPVAVAGTEKMMMMSSNFKSTVDLLDFDNDVDSPDSNCGSSFLRNSRGTLHFPCAETT